MNCLYNIRMPPSENVETPKYNLPPPVSETDGDFAVEQNTLPAAPENSPRPKVPKLNNSNSQVSDFQIGTILTHKPVPVASTTSISDNPLVADDNDLIEKEWVAKAKKIIEENREDPHNQSKEMTLFKADYMKKRYNKVIEDSE